MYECDDHVIVTDVIKKSLKFLAQRFEFNMLTEVDHMRIAIVR